MISLAQRHGPSSKLLYLVAETALCTGKCGLPWWPKVDIQEHAIIISIVTHDLVLFAYLLSLATKPCLLRVHIRFILVSLTALKRYVVRMSKYWYGYSAITLLKIGPDLHC